MRVLILFHSGNKELEGSAGSSPEFADGGGKELVRTTGSSPSTSAKTLSSAPTPTLWRYRWSLSTV